MISTGFKTNFSPSEAKKLSIVTEAGHLIFGIFDSDSCLLASDKIHHEDLSTKMAEYQDIPIYFLSKSTYFTHINNTKSNTIQNILPFRDSMAGENIETLFDDELAVNPKEYCQVRHLSTAIQNRFRFSQTPICYVHFNKNTIIVCICGSIGFKFYNEFEVETAEDILYFIKSVITTLNVDETNVVLKLGGYIEEGYAYYKILQRYFHHIELATAYNFSIKENAGKEHYYFDHYLNISF